MISTAIVVLNYNGIPHLRELLPSLREAVGVWGRHCPVIVLDNMSTDGDAEWVLKHHPWVHLERAKKNEFLFSYNPLLAQMDEQVVILLNNDMRVDPSLIEPLVRHFADPLVFSVAAACHSWDGTAVQNGPAMLRFHHGWASFPYDVSNQKTCYSLFSCGGCAAVDRGKFVKLGGFDSLYHPAYGEDLDLCYRAWARGWSSIYEPRSVVYHRENGSFGEKARHHIMRAQFLFQWRNLRAPNLRMRRGLFELWRRFVLARHDEAFQDAYREAVANWRERGREALSRAPRVLDVTGLSERLGRVATDAHALRREDKSCYADNLGHQAHL